MDGESFDCHVSICWCRRGDPGASTVQGRIMDGLYVCRGMGVVDVSRGGLFVERTAATFLYRQLSSHGRSVVIRMSDCSVESTVCVAALAGRVRGSWSR